VRLDYISTPLRQVFPQGSILRPILFSIYINEFGIGLETVNVHFYADVTIIYTMASSLKVPMDSLQNAFNSFQTSLDSLNWVMNADRLMIFYD